MDNDSSARIVTALRDQITDAAPGTRLPSTRALVEEHQASPVTVQAALRRLATEGLVETRPGVGTFVRTVRTARPHDFTWQTAALGAPGRDTSQVSAALDAPSGDALALHSGYPDRSLLPVRAFRAALLRAARSDAALHRPPAAGLPDLRNWFAQELESATPPGTSPPTAGDVIVVPGSQSGLVAIFRSLVGTGRTLVMESPTYWGAILAARQAGVEVVPVPTGGAGPNPEQLADALQRKGAPAFYAQPTFTNPAGGSWSTKTRGAVLDVMRSHGAFLIEDDWAHDLGISADPNPLAAQDDNGHVIYVRSFSKSVSPSARVAAVIARGPANRRILGDVRAESMYVSSLLQSAVLDLVGQPAWRTHLRGLRRELQSRRDLLIQSLSDHAPEVTIESHPHGGLHVWARLPERADADAVVRRCAAQGVRVTGGDEFFPAEPTGAYLRLSFAGSDPGAFPDAARTLGESLR